MRDESQPLKIHQPYIPFLIFLCTASALGGLLWGFDAIVISGTISQVKMQFDLSPSMEGFFVSSSLLGAVFGSALAGWLSDLFGRSRSLVLAAVLMWISALASCLAGSIELLIFARWLGGLGVGISAMVCPLYISEISPSHLRGRLVTVFQLAITVGIMVALFNNFGLHQWANSAGDTVGEDSYLRWFLVDETWRAMFASELVPGLLFLVLAILLPESPRWLIKVGRLEQSQKVLHRIFRNGADTEFEAIREAVAKERTIEKRFTDVFHKRYQKPLALAALLAAFAQFSGINVVFYYGTSMLETAGLRSDSALSGMAVIGFCNMIFTVIAIAYVDKFGRRPLLQIGTVGAIGCLLGIAATFNSGLNVMLITLMCSFVAFFAFSLGPIKFIFASEIFPTNIRSHAMSITILTMWATDTLVGQFTPVLRERVGASVTFFIFACILLPQIFMVWKFMPETAGRSLEEIEQTYYGHEQEKTT